MGDRVIDVEVKFKGLPTMSLTIEESITVSIVPSALWKAAGTTRLYLSSTLRRKI